MFHRDFVIIGAGPVGSGMVAPLGEFRLFTDDSLTVPGVVGSYVDQSLRFYSPDDY